MVADDWSVQVLMKELLLLYRGLVSAMPPSLPALPIQYADFTLWQRESLQRPEMEAQLAYWLSQLAGAPPVLELPTDRLRPPVQSFRGATHLFLLPVPLMTGLVRLSQREQTT